MKIPNFREKGTKLPIIPSGTQYRCTHWPESNKNSYTNNDFVSFGYKTQSDFDYIICEKEDYKGTNYYMIPESIIIDLWKKENNYVENTMEKEIIGYKLIKPEYEQAALALVNMKTNEMWNSNLKEQGWMFKPNSQNSSVFEQAGVLDLWFEPVYKVEEQVKVGDYLYFIDITRSGKALEYKDYDNSVVKVTNVRPDSSHINARWVTIDSNLFGGGFRLNGNGWVFGKHVRLATPKEIEKSKGKIISVGGQFDVTVKSTGVYHGNDDITKFVEGIISMKDGTVGGSYSFIISDITFSKTGCQNKETKLSDWKKVWGEYQRIKK